MTRHSPCVGICTLDDTTGYCLGCGRSRDEVAQWVAMSEDQRDAVWLKLPARLETLGVRVRLLPWTPEDILVWVAETIAGRRGTWTIGASGAVEKFPCTAKLEIEIEEFSDAIVARTPEASFRLRLNDKVRAFAFAEGGPIVLAFQQDAQRSRRVRSSRRSGLMPMRSTGDIGATGFSTSASRARAAGFAFGPMTRCSLTFFRLMPANIGRKFRSRLLSRSRRCAQPSLSRQPWRGSRYSRRPSVTRLNAGGRPANIPEILRGYSCESGAAGIRFARRDLLSHDGMI